MKIKDYPKRLPFNQIDSVAIQQSIDKGVRYLNEHQYPNGEFCCYYSPDDAMQKWSVPDSTVFPTAIINTCLLSVKHNFEVKNIFKKSIPFFQYQMMRGGVMNYFTKWHPLFPLVPPDIDDTIFVHLFLKSQNVVCPDPSSLFLANRAKNGLFYTWFTLRPNNTYNKDYWLILLREFKNPIKSLFFWKRNDCKRSDIDAVVNSNALLYFKDKNIRKPIINYLLKIIEEEKETKCDSWYQNPFTLYYSLSNNIKNGVNELMSVCGPIIKWIKGNVNNDGSIGISALDTAFSITILLNFNCEEEIIDNAVLFLLKSQGETGEWPRQIFFYSGPKKAVGWGSEELTTGFCIEALAKYKDFKY